MTRTDSIARIRIELKQFWHRKFHDDARNAWLRSVFCRLFQESPPGRRGRMS